MAKALRNCWRHDIITVVSAGNAGDRGSSLELATPSNLGKEDNPLITVGGVDECGVLWPRTTFDRGSGGSMTVYAVAKNVRVADYLDDNGFTLLNGTSLAAPAVAGLAVILPEDHASRRGLICVLLGLLRFASIIGR